MGLLWTSSGWDPLGVVLSWVFSHSLFEGLISTSTLEPFRGYSKCIFRTSLCHWGTPRYLLSRILEMSSNKPKYILPGVQNRRVRCQLAWLPSVRTLRPVCKLSPAAGSIVIKVALKGHAAGAEVPALPAVLGFLYTIEFCVVKTCQVLLSRRATSPWEWEESRS